MIVMIVHSGGNADIGNKLAELLMPELDEKVIFSMTAQTLDKSSLQQYLMTGCQPHLKWVGETDFS